MFGFVLSGILQKVQDAVEKFGMRIVIVREIVQQLCGEETAVQDKKIATRSGQTRTVINRFEFGQRGEFLPA